MGTPPEPPIDPHKVKVFRRSLDVSPAQAKELITDWKDALVWAVPSSRGFSGFDGASFYYSMEDKSGAYAGRTRSSDGLPVLDALQAVASTMVMECEWGARSLKSCDLPYAGDLAQQVRALSKALKAKRQ